MPPERRMVMRGSPDAACSIARDPRLKIETMTNRWDAARLALVTGSMTSHIGAHCKAMPDVWDILPADAFMLT